jgi:hypothetical protein
MIEFRNTQTWSQQYIVQRVADILVGSNCTVKPKVEIDSAGYARYKIGPGFEWTLEFGPDPQILSLSYIYPSEYGLDWKSLKNILEWVLTT